MPGMSASPEALDKMRHDINKFIQLQNEVINSLSRDYQNIGSEWKDPQYDRLGVALNEALKGIKAKEPALRDCISKINELKAKLEDYLNTRI